MLLLITACDHSPILEAAAGRPASLSASPSLVLEVCPLWEPASSRGGAVATGEGGVSQQFPFPIVKGSNMQGCVGYLGVTRPFEKINRSFMSMMHVSSISFEISVSPFFNIQFYLPSKKEQQSVSLMDLQ